jgi:hypothetical protein
MVEQFSDQYGRSIPQACADHHDMDAAYAFFANERVGPLAILHHQRQETLDRCREHPRLLVAQDTSEANYSDHPAWANLGYLDGASCLGLKFHSALAISPAGVPLGLLTQQVWRRDPASRGQAARRQSRAATQKESYRWQDHLAAIDRVVPPQVQELLVIADREGDIYNYLAQPRSGRCHLLVRLAQPQRLVVEATQQAGPDPVKPEPLLGVLTRQPWLGRHTITVPRGADGPRRKAVLHLRLAAVKVLPPKNAKGRAKLKPVQVWVVEAVELAPPGGVQPICWRLVSTKAVSSLQEAIGALEDYLLRWRVERFHYVLKSGGKVEELQLEKAERLANALAFYSQVACRVLRLTYLSRVEPQRPAEGEFDPPELQTLRGYAAQKKMTQEQQVKTVRQAIRVIAKMGGFVGRKGDGEPGVKVLWRGLVSLHDRVAGFRLGFAAATAGLPQENLLPHQTPI